jgi:hypothetical protein
MISSRPPNARSALQCGNRAIRIPAECSAHRRRSRPNTVVRTEDKPRQPSLSRPQGARPERQQLEANSGDRMKTKIARFLAVALSFSSFAAVAQQDPYASAYAESCAACTDPIWKVPPRHAAGWRGPSARRVRRSSIGLKGTSEFAGIQDLTLSYGKIHRVNDDGSIAKDNPFVDVEGALSSIWSWPPQPARFGVQRKDRPTLGN